MRERFAGDEFHDDANLPFDVEQIVEFDGVWMRNFAIGTGFVHESFDDDFIAIKLGMEFFDGDELTGTALFSEVYDAHAAGGDAFDNRVFVVDA